MNSISLVGEAKEEKVFRELYHDVFPLLVRIVYRITGDAAISEDVCQEAFSRYYERRDRLPGGEQAKFWLVRVVKNLAYDHKAWRSREQESYRRYNVEASIRGEGSREEGISEEESGAIQDLLLEIPYKLRFVLILKEYAGFSYKEIALVLKISEGNVKVRIFRARKLLRKLLKEAVNVP